jgi:exodeoxyribonuclease V alpha subunit
MGEAEQEVRGRVRRVTYRNPQNGFHVLAIEPEKGGDLFAATCTGTGFWAGRSIVMVGRWTVDRTYGRTFAAATAKTADPTTEIGLKRYLASGAFPRVGKKTAERLVNTFGINLPDVIVWNPKKIAIEPGLGIKMAETLRERWQSGGQEAPARKKREDEVFLRGIGMTTSQLRALDKVHGSKGAEIVRQDPYILASTVRGIGFERADRIADGLGISRHDPVRIRAGIVEAMRLATLNKKHCLLPVGELATESASLLHCAEKDVLTVLRSPDGPALTQIEYDGGEAWTTEALNNAEKAIATTILRMVGTKPPWQVGNLQGRLAAAEAAMGKTLTDSQRAAFFGVLQNRVAVVTGGPGTGKTTLLRALLLATSAGGARPKLSAPTGRAAMNMFEATGIDAETVHLMLGRAADGKGFWHTKDQPLDCDILALDETSMMDVPLCAGSVDALPRHAGLLMIGDANQLEPVGPGNPFADIIDSGRVPVFRLTDIKRQKAGSKIVENCQRITAGLMPELSTDPSQSDFLFYKISDPEKIAATIVELATQRLPQLLGVDPVRDIQVLSPMNVRALGTEDLCARIGEMLAPASWTAAGQNRPRFSIGDKVIHIRNNYRVGARNGQIGLLKTIDPKSGLPIVDYDGRLIEYDEEAIKELRPGWAVTVHKSQGSEFPVVIMPIVKQHAFMLRRRLLLTGVSRGKQMVVLVGHPEALAAAVRDARTEVRHTQLGRLLKAG